MLFQNLVTGTCVQRNNCIICVLFSEPKVTAACTEDLLCAVHTSPLSLCPTLPHGYWYLFPQEVSVVRNSSSHHAVGAGPPAKEPVCLHCGARVTAEVQSSCGISLTRPTEQACQPGKYRALCTDGHARWPLKGSKTTYH